MKKYQSISIVLVIFLCVYSLNFEFEYKYFVIWKILWNFKDLGEFYLYFYELKFKIKLLILIKNIKN